MSKNNRSKTNEAFSLETSDSLNTKGTETIVSDEEERFEKVNFVFLNFLNFLN